ncbi:MAG: hypothetical protein IPN07_17010 [Dehalococcoidia bacterium]|nr:hypothetical protein [Dehalococcoidia bacterium]
MAEACLHLVHGDPSVNSGHITYAADVLKNFGLAAELLARSAARVKVGVALSPGPPLHLS